jgi:hypothetical protein
MAQPSPFTNAFRRDLRSASGCRFGRYERKDIFLARARRHN